MALMSVTVKLLDGDEMEYTHVVEEAELYKKLHSKKYEKNKEALEELAGEAGIIAYKTIVDTLSEHGSFLYQYVDSENMRQIHQIKNINEFKELRRLVKEGKV